MSLNLDDSRESPYVPEAVLGWIDRGSPDPAPREVTAWLAEAPLNQSLLDDLVRVWDLSRPPVPPAGMWPNVKERIEIPAIPARADALRGAGWITGLRAAALVVLGLGLGLAWHQLQARMAPPADPVVVQVPFSATTTVELPGGITIQLNSVSRLAYVIEAGRVDEVRLEGEAYFDVPHDPDRVFRVRTAGGVVHNIGTEFNVWAREDRVSVAVAEGEVGLTSAGEVVTVSAGEIAAAESGTPPSTPEPANLSAEVAWTEGRLVFYDEPLGQIAAELERRYGIQVQVAPALRNVRLTATVNAQTSRDEAVRLVCRAIDALCEQEGGGWIIQSAD